MKLMSGIRGGLHFTHHIPLIVFLCEGRGAVVLTMSGPGEKHLGYRGPL